MPRVAFFRHMYRRRLHGAGCTLYVAWHMSYDAACCAMVPVGVARFTNLLGACCVLHVACIALHAACCIMHAASCTSVHVVACCRTMLLRISSFRVAWCTLHVACPRCMSRASRQVLTCPVPPAATSARRAPCGSRRPALTTRGAATTSAPTMRTSTTTRSAAAALAPSCFALPSSPPVRHTRHRTTRTSARAAARHVCVCVECARARALAPNGVLARSSATSRLQRRRPRRPVPATPTRRRRYRQPVVRSHAFHADERPCE